MTIDKQSSLPVFRQIMDSILDDVQTGARRAGDRLPTVRELSRETGVSGGTVKHAYDLLEQMGIVSKTQGRGTFIAAAGAEQGSKDRAVAAINDLLDSLSALGFSYHEMRIYFDLLLRQRESESRPVRVCVVDCSTEALSVIASQLSKIRHVETAEILLEEMPGQIARAPYDLCITTPSHFEEVCAATTETPMRIVLTISPSTVLAISRIAPGARVGILAASARFSGIMEKALAQYAQEKATAQKAFFGEATDAFFEAVDIVLLPPNYERVASPEEMARIRQRENIVYKYRIDRGSLLYVEEAVERLYREINA